MSAEARSGAVDQRAYFDAMYGASDDPYALGTRWYERRKRALVLASLPRARFRSAYEPGCGVGELSVALAGRSDALLASDRSAQAVDIARGKLASLANAQVACHALPDDWPRTLEAERFDLIVLSEVGYFMDAAAWRAVARCCDESLAQDGVLVACDWLPDFEERVQSTAGVHATLAGLGLPLIARHQEDDFLLQVWARDPRSVAQQEGIR